MKISTKACYGLKILSVLAENYSSDVVSSARIAKQEKISKKYADNLLAILEKSKIVSSQRGPKGGYLLMRPPNAITVREIFEILEGSVLSVNCLDRLRRCRYYDGCNGQQIWLNLKNTISAALNKITLADISKKKEIYYI